MKGVSSRKLEFVVIIISTVLFAIVMGFSLISTNDTIDDNVNTRAFSQLRDFSVDQSQLIDNELSHHFDVLEKLGSTMENPERFGEKESSAVLQAFIIANRWALLGYADADGNAVDHLGNSLGNISGRNYFTDAVSGASDRSMDYIPDTVLRDGPKLVFSIPVRKDGAVSGVLFASVDTNDLDRVILGNADSDSSVGLYFIDSDGFILASNQFGSTQRVGVNFFDGYDEGTFSDGMTESKLKTAMARHKNGSYMFSHGQENEYAIYTWTGVNDWYVVSAADIEKIKTKYATNMANIKNLVASNIMAFAAMLLVMVGFTALSLKKMSKAEKFMLLEKTRNDRLLEASKSEQFIYEVKTRTVTGKGSLVTEHDSTEPKDFLSAVHRITLVYPELENQCVLLVKAVENVAETGRTRVIDRPIMFRKKHYWIKVILAPYKEDGKNISHVFCSILDTSYMHLVFQRAVDTLENMPGGSHRCYLNEPIHLEAISDGLSRMLGYRKEEIFRLTNGEYALLIAEEDRPRFREFIHRMAQEEKTETCEYRMVRKDGSLVYVTDTMESMRNEEGIMYGYSAVTDITQKAEELEAAREKIKITEERENYLLNERLLLASATRIAYSIVVSVNLTQNTYYVMERDHRIIRQVKESGKMDDFIDEAIASIPDPAQAVQFGERFRRRALADAYQRGEKSVSMRHKKVGDDGLVHWVDSQAIFVTDGDTADIRAIILAAIADEKQNMIEELQDSLRKESVYRKAVMTRSTGYMEINFSTGFIEGDILYRTEESEYMKMEIPELGSPLPYDDFERWWADQMVVSDKESFVRMSNAAYFLDAYSKGIHYVEVPCRSKGFADEGEQEYIELYFLSEDELTGDIKAICILHNTTWMADQNKKIMQLTADLREARIKNSISQMQPHFLYNALASIREIILDNPQYASDLICDFTTYLRACVRSMSNNDLVPFSQEMENIKAYVNIEKMRFGDRLKIRYDIGCEDFMIVPLSIQPLAENAIRHGIYQRGAKGGTLSVSTSSTDDAYIIVVEDDGVGFDYEKMKGEVERGERDSTGLSNMRFRLEKMLGATLTIHSEIGVGTKITVEIPAVSQHRERCFE